MRARGEAHRTVREDGGRTGIRPADPPPNARPGRAPASPGAATGTPRRHHPVRPGTRAPPHIDRAGKAGRSARVRSDRVEGRRARWARRVRGAGKRQGRRGRPTGTNEGATRAWVRSAGLRKAAAASNGPTRAEWIGRGAGPPRPTPPGGRPLRVEARAAARNRPTPQGPHSPEASDPASRTSPHASPGRRPPRAAAPRAAVRDAGVTARRGRGSPPAGSRVGLDESVGGPRGPGADPSGLAGRGAWLRGSEVTWGGSGRTPGG